MPSMTIPKSTSDDSNEMGVRIGAEAVMIISKVFSLVFFGSWLAE